LNTIYNVTGYTKIVHWADYLAIPEY